MKKAQIHKKLQLNRETLVPLNDEALDRVNGGRSVVLNSVLSYCPSNGCAPSYTCPPPPPPR